MATLYLVEQNTVLRKTSERLAFCKKPPRTRGSPGLRQMDVLVEFPCEDIDQVMIFGNVQITTQAMHQLLKHDIETAIFTFHGRLVGQLTPPGAKNILLRQMQYKKYQDEEFKLQLSKSIVNHKIKSSLTLLRDYERNHAGTFKKDEISSIQAIANKVKTAKSLDTLRGFEGSASAQYFSLLGRMLSDKFQFLGRSRRPPKDPPNAVLSFGYTIVNSELWSLLDGIGFDPYLGYYHQIRYGRPGLALDLLELFRHSFIDRLMLNLFNRSILNADDFTEVGKGGIYLATSGKKKFFEQYERLMGHYKGQVPRKKNRGTVRRTFQQQVEHLMKTIKDDKPFIIVKQQKKT